MPDPNAFKRFLPVEESYVGSVARSSFPGYLTPKAPSFVSHQPLGSSDLRVASDFPQREISAVRPSPYGLDETAGIGVHPEPVMCAITAGASVKGYSSPPQDPSLIVQRRDVALGIGPPIPGRIEMPNSLRNVNGSPLIKGESNILFVDGLPTDCTRREVAHLFRPFIGYREIKVVHKEPRRVSTVNLLYLFGGRAYIVKLRDSFIHLLTLVLSVRNLDGGILYPLFIASLTYSITYKLLDLSRTCLREYRVWVSVLQSGDKAMVLCFVEFMDSKCAVTAMEALNGYKFDDKKPESPTLRIQFAQFPFRPSDGDEQRIGIPR
ncbi:hypothetical protein Pint_13749 [Pistacia integerrima]|uniref:Uncharacterized protein n=1 Tax=Pistacia integerrima TaxID=434235 RepID=A0ACC0YBE0_9ROSI|nr:hypothetical protein Pint_13749 [Pistacia integerrima]